jgi:hypothetical protein
MKLAANKAGSIRHDIGIVFFGEYQNNLTSKFTRLHADKSKKK